MFLTGIPTSLSITEIEELLLNASRCGDDAILHGITLSHVPVVFRGRVYTVHDHSKVMKAFGQASSQISETTSRKSEHAHDKKQTGSVVLSDRAEAVVAAMQCMYST